jgi:hypothetical protein
VPAKDYESIASRTIVKPSQIKKIPRILVYGRNKKGKSTFGASAPDVLIADPEQGSVWMKGLDPDIWPLNRWEDLNDLYSYLRLGKHPYKWVVLDGLTRINDMALDFTMKIREEKAIDSQPGMVDRRDWGQAGKVMKTMMVNFYNLPNIGVIYTAQERPLEQQGSEADEEAEETPMGFVADLPKGSRGSINSLVDVIGRIYVVDVDYNGTTKKQRRLWLSEHPLYDTGGRSDHVLPDYIKNPTVPKLLELLETGKVPVRKRAQ